MYKTYTKKTYEESIKSKRELIKSSSYYVDGYCEIPNGILYFKGDIPGVSEAQARYYIVYMIRDIYGPEVWINPIFFSIGKLTQSTKFEDRSMYFNLKPYYDDIHRKFIEFSAYERNKQYSDKQEVGDLMPQYYIVDTLPETKEVYVNNNNNNNNNIYNKNNYLPTFEPVFDNCITFDDNTTNSKHKTSHIEDNTKITPNFEIPSNFDDLFFDYKSSYSDESHSYSVAWLEDMCNLPEGVGLFDDDR